MSDLQFQSLKNCFSDCNSYGKSTAGCFDPHFGLVFYKKSQIIAHISICLECNFFRASPEIDIGNLFKLKKCKSRPNGFLNKGRNTISKLVKELKFSHWELNSELFDKP